MIPDEVDNGPGIQQWAYRKNVVVYLSRGMVR
jgi:hypothetical protein